MKRQLFVLAGLFLVPFLASAEDYVRGAAVIQDLVAGTTTVTGQEITLPVNPELRTTIYTLEPGKRLPTHKHIHQRLAYILDGAIDLVNAEEDTVTTYKKGNFLIEMRDQWHYGINSGTKPVTLFVIDIVPIGESVNVILESGKTPPAPPTPPEIFTTTMSGNPIELPVHPEIRTLMYEAKPKEVFPLHKHPYLRMLHVVEGEIDIIDSASHEIRKVRAGTSLIESVERWHYGENNGSGPLKVLVIDFVPPNTGNNVEFKDSLH